MVNEKTSAHGLRLLGVEIASRTWVAERELCAAGWLNPDDMLAAARKHGITAETFADPRHRVIFEYLLSIAVYGCDYAGGWPSMDEIVEVAEHENLPFDLTKYAGDLYQFRTDVLNSSPASLDDTAAALADFVRRRERARALLREAAALVGGAPERILAEATPRDRRPVRKAAAGTFRRGVRRKAVQYV